MTTIGKIIKTRAFLDKIIYKVELSQQEALRLRGRVTNIHMFAADLCTSDAKIIERGIKKGAKYVTIPLSLRPRKRKMYHYASYQKIEVADKVFFICTVEKDPLFS